MAVHARINEMMETARDAGFSLFERTYKDDFKNTISAVETALTAKDNAALAELKHTLVALHTELQAQYEATTKKFDELDAFYKDAKKYIVLDTDSIEFDMYSPYGVLGASKMAVNATSNLIKKMTNLLTQITSALAPPAGGASAEGPATGGAVATA